MPNAMQNYPMQNYQSRESADKVIYTRGKPPVGEADTPENIKRKADAYEGVAHGMTLPNEEDVNIGAPGCQRCEVVPKPLRGPGVVHLRFAHTHSIGKVLNFLADSSWKHSEREGSISVHVGTGSLAPLLSPIVELLSSPERRDTRAMFQPDGELVQISDYFEIEALPDFVHKARSEWLLDILREKRLRSVFQPIVMRDNGNGSSNGANGATRKIFAYECLMRADVDGEAVNPGTMIEMARNAGLIFQLDLAARRAAIRGAAEHRIEEKVFVNFAPNSIYNPTTCLDSTVRLVDEVGLKREQVVFEIVESERLPETKLLKRIISYYRDNGFGVALDDVGAGFSSLSLLLDLRPDFAKIDMSLIRGVHEDAGKALVARKLLEAAKELDMKTVAEGIETPEELEWVDEHGADFVQGYFFARPASPPPVLTM